MHSNTLITIFGTSALFGCIGTIEPDAHDNDPADRHGDDPPGQSDTSLPPTPDTTLRRLTRTEYNNTVRDLLGDTQRLGDALPSDVTFNGFDNNAEMSKAIDLAVDSAVDRYDVVARELVENAFRAGGARKKLLGTCEPVTSACARSVLSAFARRAWRRPVEAPE